MRGKCLNRFLKLTVLLIILFICLYNFKLWKTSKEKHDTTKKMLVFETQDSQEFLFKPISANQNHEKPQDLKFIEVDILSSKDLIKLSVNDKLLFKSSDIDNRGIYIFVLNQKTGDLMGHEIFDTFAEGQGENLQNFIDMISDLNRLLVFAVKDEASFNLDTKTRQKLKELGSNLIFELNWRCMWAMVTTKSGKLLSENLQKNLNSSSWAEPVLLNIKIPINNLPDIDHCNWPKTIENQKRANFCSRFDGYGDLCNCKELNILKFEQNNFSPNFVENIPVSIIASNRPHYLYRMLQTLMLAQGVNPKVVTVFIDGHYEETKAIAELFGIKGIFHDPVGTKNGRISQHYLFSLSLTFNLYPDAEYAILLEEDLDVSPDFFRYFSQTMHLLADSSLYCISAWNDHGYEHSCQDPSLLYRVETMPGLGWMLKRSLFKDELEPNWPSPDKNWDWDMWMRHPEIRKGRECIIPDVPRTFHFGTSGVNMNTYFFQMYFSRHKINKIPDVVFKDVDTLLKDNYENYIHQLIRKSKVIDVRTSPCDQDIFTDNEPLNLTYVVYFQMENYKDLKQFVQLCKCLKIWDLDARGLHKSMFRTFVKNRHVIFIGYPASAYSIYKPVLIKPVSLLNESSHDSEL